MNPDPATIPPATETPYRYKLLMEDVLSGDFFVWASFEVFDVMQKVAQDVMNSHFNWQAHYRDMATQTTHVIPHLAK